MPWHTLLLYILFSFGELIWGKLNIDIFFMDSIIIA